MKTNDLISEATAVLLYKNVLPKTTVKMLETGIKTGNQGKLSEGLRLAHLHDDKLNKARLEAAEIEQLIAEETAIEALAAQIENKKLEAIELHNFLDSNVRLIHPTKQMRYTTFLDEIEEVLDGGIEEVTAWIKRAKDFKQGIDGKLRQAPRQTIRIAA